MYKIFSVLLPILVLAIGCGESGGTGSDAGNGADADGSVEQDTDEVPTCEGVICQGNNGQSMGTCFIDSLGFPACDCDNPEGLCHTQLVPTRDLRCLTFGEYCEHLLGYGCEDSQSWCRMDMEVAQCEGICFMSCGQCPVNCDPAKSFNDNLPDAWCDCQGADTYNPDTKECEPDVAKCDESYPYDDPLYDLQVSGAVSFRLVDGVGAGENWGSSGYLALFNEWPEAHCGTFSYVGGSKIAGSYDVENLDIQIDYADGVYGSKNDGAEGTVTVNDITWCQDFDCTVFDVDIDATLASEDGATIDVVGFVRGTF